MDSMRMDSINGSPVVEYRRRAGIIERRTLTPEGREWRDGASTWAPVSERDLAYQIALGGPVGDWLATSRAAAVLGRKGGKAGRGDSKARPVTSEQMRAVRAARPPRDYVADRRAIRYTPEGRRIVDGGWAILRWDAARSIWVEPGSLYATQREARDVLREERTRV